MIMRLRATDRGLAVQVGVTILLGFVVIALATYQVQVVPGQNAEVEFSHSQTVQGELQDVRGAIVSVPGGGNGRSVSVQLGTTYPSRTIFVNPSPPTGQLRTANAGELTIDNARAVGSDEIDDFWTGDPRSINTTTLEYRPNYNVYQNGPTTVIDNTVVFDRQPRSGDRVIDTGQRLIDGDRINLVAVQGDYQEASARSVAVDVRAVSSSTRTVTVTGENGNNITITVPTQLSANDWDGLIDDPDVSVSPVAGANAVEIELDGSETYELRMAKAGLTNGVSRPTEAYLTPVGDTRDGVRADEGVNETLVVEVRDEYNNPVSGVAVNASTSRSDSNVNASDPSDADGRVELEYQPPDDIDGGNEDDVVNVSYTGDATNGFDADAPENATVEVRVNNADGSGTGGGGGFDPENGVVVTDASTQGNNQVDITFENRGGTERNITAAQFTAYVSNNDKKPQKLIFGGTELPLAGDLIDLPGGISLSPEGQPGDSTTEMAEIDGGNANIQNVEFFVLTVEFENGQIVQYLIAPD